ncbi:hypothetical protein BWR18_14015 [Tateyamaria omphalii]|uniref:Uncharacterized protein n=2 Tax=Tateyamaria omphalii TaxID=299262 RepID=A0A1P8MX55_9RHOB|nr:hypothetical protein BWR18_14015 [Tateyamaria omphalii]
MRMTQPRPGLLGSWDRFVGPGMSRGETLVLLGATLAGGALVAVHLYTLGLPWLLIALGALVAADVIGGAVCNMTETTKRWYHRPEQRRRDHLGFIALHVCHVVIVAWAFRGPGFDSIYALSIGGWLVLSAILVLCAPTVLRSPLATTFFAVALGLSLYALGPTPGFEWFVPLLFIKLLIGHAVPVKD